MLQRKLRIEALEDRRLLAVFTVSNDSMSVGVENSLPWAINQANMNFTGVPDIIQFDSSETPSITVSQAMPIITGPTRFEVEMNDPPMTLRGEGVAVNWFLFEVTTTQSGPVEFQDLILRDFFRTPIRINSVFWIG